MPLNTSCPSTLHPQFAPALLELPGIEPAMGRQAQVDAGVRGQVLRRLWPCPFGEIGRRADDRRAHVRPDAHGDHVLRHHLAGANAGVEALGDDVGQAVVDHDLHLDVRIVRQKFRQRGPQDRPCRVLVRRDADGAGRACRAARSARPAPPRSRPAAAPRHAAGAPPPRSARRCGWCGSAAAGPAALPARARSGSAPTARRQAARRRG